MSTLILSLLLLCTCICTAQAQNRWFRPDELFSYAVTALCADTVPRGIWGIVCNPAGASYGTYAVQGYDGSSWHTYSTAEYGYPVTESIWLRDIALDAHQNVVVAARNYILRFNRTSRSWKAVDFPDSLQGERDFNYVFTDTKGRIWITAESRTVLQRDTINGVVVSRIIPYNEIFLLGDDALEKVLHYTSTASPFTTIQEDSKGDLWVAHKTQNGSGLDALMKYNGTTFTAVPLPPAVMAVRGRTTTLYIDKLDNFYIGCQSFEDAGVHKPPTVTKISKDLTMAVNYEIPYGTNASPEIHRVVERNGILYAGTRDGLYTINGDEIRRIEMRDYFPDFTRASNLQSTNGLHIRDNALYCATTWGVVIFDPLSGLSNVQEERNHQAASIRPNPVKRNGSIMVDPFLEPGEAVTGIKVINITGEEIHIPVAIEAMHSTPIRIAIEGLPCGIYILRATTTKRQHRAKFIITDP